jgi:hypothetical protein
VLDHRSEQLIPLSQVPDHLPRTNAGNRPHPATIYRWVSRGIRGTKLETIRIGGRRLTSVEAIDRFIECTSRRKEANPKPELSPVNHRKRVEKASRRVKEIFQRDASVTPSRRDR